MWRYTLCLSLSPRGCTELSNGNSGKGRQSRNLSQLTKPYRGWPTLYRCLSLDRVPISVRKVNGSFRRIPRRRYEIDSLSFSDRSNRGAVYDRGGKFTFANCRGRSSADARARAWHGRAHVGILCRLPESERCSAGAGESHPAERARHPEAAVGPTTPAPSTTPAV